MVHPHYHFFERPWPPVQDGVLDRRSTKRLKEFVPQSSPSTMVEVVQVTQNAKQTQVLKRDLHPFFEGFWIYHDSNGKCCAPGYFCDLSSWNGAEKRHVTQNGRLDRITFESWKRFSKLQPETGKGYTEYRGSNCGLPSHHLFSTFPNKQEESELWPNLRCQQ